VHPRNCTISREYEQGLRLPGRPDGIGLTEATFHPDFGYDRAAAYPSCVLDPTLAQFSGALNFVVSPP